jgi:protocatechuate 3,4-dioxygenase beta subunit
MVSSCRQTILCILLLLSLAISARSQSTVDKAVTSTISGKVTVGGKGLSGVVVGLAISNQTRSNFRPTRFRSTTDEEGNYRIIKVPPGTYEVIVASPTYVPTEGRKSLIISKNETLENIDITLASGGAITGKVTDADGNPVIEETVYVSAVTTGYRLPYFRNIRTDDRGIYRAYGIPAGRYNVSAGKNSARPSGGRQRTYHPSTVDPDAAFIIDVSEGSEATNVDITLAGPARTYSARGRIIDIDTAQPVPNTRVGVQTFRQNYISANVNGVESTKEGEFRVENLLPGKYGVYSVPPADSDWHSEAVEFEVTDRDVEGLLIKTSKGASVSGVVILEGTDDPKVRASLLAGRIIARIADGYVGRSAPSANINPNGSFRINGLAAGRLTLHLETRERLSVIRLERNGMPQQGGVEIKEREQVTGLRVVVGKANGAIRGVVIRPAGFELPATARILLVVRKTGQDTGLPVGLDARGHFHIENLIPGTYDIRVMTVHGPPSQSPLLPTVRQTVEVTNGAETAVTITLQLPKPRPQ